VVFRPLDGDPFKGRLNLFRANYNYEKAKDSSGLGLSLSKKIMKKFGGSLDFSLSQEKFLVSHLVFVRGTKTVQV
jgi:signal transduction histidine kinase